MTNDFKSITEIRNTFENLFPEVPGFWVLEAFHPSRPGTKMSYEGGKNMSRDDFVDWMDSSDWFFDANVEFGDGSLILADDDHIWIVGVLDVMTLKQKLFEYWRQTIVDSWSPSVDGELTTQKLLEMIDDPNEWPGLWRN